jgi:hypothetical protein
MAIYLRPVLSLGVRDILGIRNTATSKIDATLVPGKPKV